MSTLEMQVRIAAPVEEVWAVLADFGGVAQWAPTVNHAVITNGLAAGLDCTRECTVEGFGKVKEQIVEWNEGESYTYELGATGPMKRARNTWAARPEGKGTRVTFTVRFETRFGPLGAVLDRLVMRRKFAQQMRPSLAGLKQYVETGEPVRSVGEISLPAIAAVA
jgi:uncharacterized protein YndB with AHSA1/START domain